ncbi:threonylcarbamoyl-AMP synthase [Acidiferrimicrobium sp. IK]|uniref:L-threonylcarbamoyladenylate synthase n=1 Tax=Acidiferrimicrobium sp. IK TaxID=2871700 RepID=UPI0021CB70BD|nr:L-threonylcarbamoyladenylate synthase [Acidiferrimicrobium sp. IK]MCU4186483.1 threonylcarbamoyl-AMP synthase [Acidiferrimicrobium sp. IK]
MAILAALGDPPPEEAVAAAVEALRAGDIVGLPTDTVYGLAADPWGTGAVDRLFRIKARPRSVELPVLVSGVEQALELATEVPDVARRLMDAYWPGALTLVLPRRADLAADLGEDDATIGVRCPAHPVPLAVCRRLGPIATTSANLHGSAPATTAAEVAALPGLGLVLDAGTCQGQPSTVVDCTGADAKVLRQGSVLLAGFAG